MTSNDEVQEVATTSGAMGGPGKVNVRNHSTLHPGQLLLMPELKLVIAHLLFRFSEGGSGGFPIFIFTSR